MNPKRDLIPHLRSNAIAYLALFVALGGTAYAASLPSNSVGTKQLKSGAVKASKIHSGAVTSSKVKDSSLLRRDFASGSIPKGDRGPTGPSGPTGVTGTTGGVDTTILWAVVKAGDNVTPAVLARGEHAISTTRIGAGAYEVKFDRPVSNCAYDATIGGDSSVAIPGSYPPAWIGVNSKTGALDTVFVNMTTISALNPLDAGFHLTVAC